MITWERDVDAANFVCPNVVPNVCVCFVSFVYNFGSGREEESAALEPSALPDHVLLGVQIKNSLHSTVAAAWRGFNCWLMQDLWRCTATPAGSFRREDDQQEFMHSSPLQFFFFPLKIKILRLFNPTARGTLPALHHLWRRFAKKNKKK